MLSSCCVLQANWGHNRRFSLSKDTNELDKALVSLSSVTNVQTTAKIFATIDSDVEINVKISMYEIVQSLQSQNESESEEELHIHAEEVTKVTAAEARTAIKKLPHFAEQQEKVNRLYSLLETTEDRVGEIGLPNLKKKLNFFTRV